MIVKNKMQAIIIARVSTEDQKIAGSSLPAQLRRMQHYCEHRNIEIIETFSFDESAFKIKRDEFDKILKVITKVKGKVAVCFDKVDRLSRNTFDKRVSLLYEKAVKDEIELHFISDGQVINADMNAGDKFAFAMKLGLAKYYSDAISDNVKRVFEMKRANGQWTGKVRLGYLNIPMDKERRIRQDIVIDKERGHLITKMFELYASGNYSLNSIKETMTTLGLRNRMGSMLPKSSFHNMLSDSFYAGIAVSPKYGSYAHVYPRLISKQLFDKCQSLLKKKLTNPNKPGQEFIFRGIFTCKYCGCSITPERKKKPSGTSYIYYSCTNSKNICKRIYVREDLLLQSTTTVLDCIKGGAEKLIKRLTLETQRKSSKEINFHKSQINTIKLEIESITEKKNRLLDLYIEQNISKSTYEIKFSEYEQKVSILAGQLQKPSIPKIDLLNNLKSLQEFSENLIDSFQSSEVAEKNEILKLVFQNSTISGKKTDFITVFPFHMLVKFHTCPVMLPQLDDFRTFDWISFKEAVDKCKQLMNKPKDQGKLVDITQTSKKQFDYFLSGNCSTTS